MPRILIVDDDVSLAENVKLYLERETFKVDLVHDGEDARLQLKDDIYDLVILDWNLPGITGIEICQGLRAKGNVIPVLMLTANAEIDSKDLGFAVGADDYLTKPFDLRELLARVRALLRRSRSITPSVVLVGDLEIDTAARVVRRGAVEVHLQPREFDVLEYFLRHPGEVVNADTLLLSVWGHDSDSTSESVYICIARLRKKLGMTGKDAAIRTHYGLGYCFTPPSAGIRAAGSDAR